MVNSHPLYQLSYAGIKLAPEVGFEPTGEQVSLINSQHRYQLRVTLESLFNCLWRRVQDSNLRMLSHDYRVRAGCLTKLSQPSLVTPVGFEPTLYRA